MRLSYFAILFVFIALGSCQLVEKKADNTNSDKNGPTVIKSYYEKSRALKSEITVKDNKKNGLAKEYYPTGELRIMVNYVDNIKEGKTIWYYKNGQPYRVTPYVHGKMQGIRTIYYENGELQAEIPYEKGELTLGTKEYSKNGTLISNSQKIVFEELDLLKEENQFILKMKLSKKSKKVTFFEEKLSTEGNKILVSIYTNLSGTGEIKYILPRGTFKKEILKIYAKYETKLGNPALISKSYKLEIENN